MLQGIFRHVRLINLAIVWATQWLIYKIFFGPVFNEASIDLTLSNGLIHIFALDTVLITWSGYLINDYFDQDTDAANTNKISHWSKQTLMKCYLLAVTLGFIIAAYIGLHIGRPLLILIYPLAVGLLFGYSSKWKGTVLWGNIIVSIFCAFVPGILWYAESRAFQKLQKVEPNSHEVLTSVLMCYIIFAFLSTLAREMVKDIEDMDGDGISGLKTLPVVVGKERAKLLAWWTTGLLLLSYLFWFTLPAGPWTYVSIIFLLVLPTIYILYVLYSAKEQKEFTIISKQFKILMILSLILFLCLPMLIL